MKLFFTIEGGDGSGKATQVKLLEGALRDLGFAVLHQEFPRYGKGAAYATEQYLQGAYGKVSGKIGTIFYTVDRYDALRTEIEPFYEEHPNGIVVADRWVTANKGHQAGKGKTKEEREEMLSYINFIEHEVMQLPEATHTIFLDMHPVLGQILGTNSKNPNILGRDLHVDDVHHLLETRRSYLEVAKKEGWSIVNAMHKKVEEYTTKEILEKEIEDLMRSRVDIHQDILQIVKEFLP